MRIKVRRRSLERSADLRTVIRWWWWGWSWGFVEFFLVRFMAVIFGFRDGVLGGEELSGGGGLQRDASFSALA